MEENLTYSEAIAEVEALIKKMEQPDNNLELLTSQVKRASELLNFCKSQLLITKAEVENLTGNKDE
ncbi:MAG TPA: exodeoxyribonuclease VII small subunit [Bacteroidales bacterium]|nr:exodeoxyribonuclease VII small subunit [Bacteroidales bacterium]